jgi:hypothetical protein
MGRQRSALDRPAEQNEQRTGQRWKGFDGGGKIPERSADVLLAGPRRTRNGDRRGLRR